MTIKIYPNPILRIKTNDVTYEEAEKLKPTLIDKMINYSGIGLAACQIGISRKIAVVSEKATGDKPLFLINPVILETKGKQSIEEGCLSIKGITSFVPRAAFIKVETGIEGEKKIIEADGLLAIVIQHEIDHLNGILFIDRLNLPKKLWCLLKARYNKKMKKKL